MGTTIFWTKLGKLSVKRSYFRRRKSFSFQTTQFKSRSFNLVKALFEFGFIGVFVLGWREGCYPFLGDSELIIFIVIWSSYVFFDVVNSFFVILKLRFNQIMIVFFSILVISTSMFGYGLRLSNKMKIIANQNNRTFSVNFDLPIGSFNNNYRIPYYKYCRLEMDSNGIITVPKHISENNEIPIVYNSWNNLNRWEYGLLADAKTNLRHIYNLEYELFKMGAKNVSFILANADDKYPWWYNEMESRLMIRLPNLAAPYITEENFYSVLIKQFESDLMILISESGFILDNHQISTSDFKEIISSKFINQEIISLAYEENCTYGRYIAVWSILFSSLDEARNSYAKNTYNQTFDNLNDSLQRRVKNEIRFKFRDKSSIEYFRKRYLESKF